MIRGKSDCEKRLTVSGVRSLSPTALGSEQRPHPLVNGLEVRRRAELPASLDQQGACLAPGHFVRIIDLSRKAG
jgi:hypothetical protein